MTDRPASLNPTHVLTAGFHVILIVGPSRGDGRGPGPLRARPMTYTQRADDGCASPRNPEGRTRSSTSRSQVRDLNHASQVTADPLQAKVNFGCDASGWPLPCPPRTL